MMRRCVLVLLVILAGCSQPVEPPQKALADAAALRAKGDFTQAAAVLGAALTGPKLSSDEVHELSLQRDMLRRIRLDYPYTQNQLYAELSDAVQDLSAHEFQTWVKQGRFDGKVIDGKLKYVGTSVANLFFRYPELRNRRTGDHDDVPEQKGRMLAMLAIKKAAREQKTPFVLPRYFLCNMSVTADADVVPAGGSRDQNLIRAWLPIPREYPYQSQFKLIASSTPVLALSGPESPIRSAYMEQHAARGSPTTFSITYSYMRSGVYFDMDPDKVHCCDPNDPGLKKFTSESPHVIFTDKIKALGGEIAGKETNSYRVAKAFFDWIGSNIKYSYAREYSTLGNISDYCLTNCYGDCGQEAMLFITLCRSRGIPARWQTGWDLWPGAHDIHDWSEIYLAPYGWVPVDPWAGLYATRYCTSLTAAQRKELHDFYFGGLDYYRMAANGDHSQTLNPPKQTLRSDDIDFQRGELEAGSRNLYFDKYSYHMGVREFGCPPFSIDDLKNFAAIADKLVHQSDPMSNFLWQHFSDDDQLLLRNYESSSLSLRRAKLAVVDNLNNLIETGNPAIYAPDRFAGVMLPPGTAELLEKDPSGPELSRLNRLLVEAAYPGELAKSQD
jgi:transglutaminase-like putative cysteine protease